MTATMTATINHVSVLARDLDDSVAFYRDLFDMEPVPTPNFEVPVQWMQCGDAQLHLFEREVDAPSYHHFGITVPDFEAVYRYAVETDCFANWDDSAPGALFELPDGVVQLYINDPAGNLVEVDHPDVTTLDDDLREQITNRSELTSQSGEAARATLNLRE
ncbi:VOC family protein [Halogeometricum limi]|nr:VOC family protein [Halogeometricum limi]